MEIERTQIACFSGHRDSRLPQTEAGRNLLIQYIDSAIADATSDGYDVFLMGACYGFDLLCAERVLNYNEIHYPYSLHKQLDPVAIVPYRGQEKHWSPENQKHYAEILRRCSKIFTLLPHYTRDCFHKRNRFLVDNSSRLICYCDGKRSGTKYTLDYAKKQGITIVSLPYIPE